MCDLLRAWDNLKGWLELGLIQHFTKEQQIFRDMARQRKRALSLKGQQIM